MTGNNQDFYSVFPRVNDAELVSRLMKPKGQADVVLDTDTYNEIDDQFALAYLVRSEEECRIRAITAAPFYSAPNSGRVMRSSSPKDGMEKSYGEIRNVLALMNRQDLYGIVYRGSDAYLPAALTPVHSPAAAKIIELSHEYSASRPLFVVAIGAITNIASALLIDPTLRERIVVIWLGGHAQHYGLCTDFNMIQDIDAARVVFSSGVPLVQLPCLGVVSEFRFTRPELEALFRGKNALCNYLLDNTYAYAKQKFSYENWSKPLWDVAAVAWLMKDPMMMDRIIPSPIPQYDHSYGIDPSRHPIRYVYFVDKDKLTEDLRKKLTL